MKDYHTEIVIQRSPEDVWAVLTDFSAYPAWNPLVGWLKGELVKGTAISMFIKPLNRSFTATLTEVVPKQNLTWVGVQIAPWIISGEHYYRLEPAGANATRLLHGEYFRGLVSALIPRSKLEEMRLVFERHNEVLKQRVESR